MEQHRGCLLDAANQEKPPNLEVPRMRSIQPVAMRFERRPRGVERRRRPAQVARDECDLSLGDDATRAEWITRGEGTRRGCDHRVHRNRVTVVTPSAAGLRAKSIP